MSGSVPGNQDGLRGTGKFPQFSAGPGPCISRRLGGQRAGTDSMLHPAENPRPPRAAQDLAQGYLVLFPALHVGDLLSAAEDRSAVLLREIGGRSCVINVAVGDQHGPGLCWLQADVPDRRQNMLDVPRVAAVDQDEVNALADNDPVRRRSLHEVDAFRRFRGTCIREPFRVSMRHVAIL